MRQTTLRKPCWKGAVAVLGLCSLASASGCQIDVNGQTIPSGYYQKDDIQYFPPGPEFKLSREAAAQREFIQERTAQAR